MKTLSPKTRRRKRNLTIPTPSLPEEPFKRKVNIFIEDDEDDDIDVKIQEPTLQLSMQDFQKEWESVAKTVSPLIMRTVAASYGIMEVISTLQQRMQDEQVDPKAEIRSDQFEKMYNFLVCCALIETIAPHLFREEDIRKSVLEKAFALYSVKGKSFDLRSFLRQQNEKLATDNTGDFYGLGVTESYNR